MGKKKPEIDQPSIFDDTSTSLLEIRSDLPDDTEGLTPEGKHQHKHKRNPSSGRIIQRGESKRVPGTPEAWQSWIDRESPEIL